jgi:hypothetical protein
MMMYEIIKLDHTTFKFIIETNPIDEILQKKVSWEQ